MEITTGQSSLPAYQRFIQIVYTEFADERGFVIDGVERSWYDRPALYGGRSLYSAQLSVSGKHTGYLKAADVAISNGSIDGTIQSALDGHQLALGPLG